MWLYFVCVEPLYQVYNKEILQEEHRQSKKKDNEYEDASILPPPASRLSASSHLRDLTDDLMKKGSTMRILWSELPSVRSSGYLDNISPDDRKRQEVQYTSVLTNTRLFDFALENLKQSIWYNELSKGGSYIKNISIGFTFRKLSWIFRYNSIPIKRLKKFKILDFMLKKTLISSVDIISSWL